MPLATAAPSPLTDPGEGKSDTVSQISSVSWEVTRAGNWDAGWVAGAKKPRQQAQLCHSLTVTLSRLLPLWASLPTQPRAGS